MIVLYLPQCQYTMSLLIILCLKIHCIYDIKKKSGSGGIRTHAPEETGALNQRLRPLGHATLVLYMLNLGI